MRFLVVLLWWNGSQGDLYKNEMLSAPFSPGTKNYSLASKNLVSKID